MELIQLHSVLMGNLKKLYLMTIFHVLVREKNQFLQKVINILYGLCF